MDTQILKDIGLSNAEIKVYLALLELGTATAGPILEKSKLQNSVVHMTLNKLVTKGFVSFIKEGQRNHYQATDPKHISEYIDEKKAQFEMILPELLGKQQLAKEKSEVTSFGGKKGIRIEEMEESSINLLEKLEGYEKLVIMDSICTEKGRPGSVYRFSHDALRGVSSSFSSHKMGLVNILKLADKLKMDVPKKIVIIAMEIEYSDGFSAEITSAVKENLKDFLKLAKEEILSYN